MEMIVRIDRRAEVIDEVVRELAVLEESVIGLDVEPLDRDVVEAAPDEGKFRDFVTVARVTHASADALEVVAEELVDRFGWLVDIAKAE